MDNAWNRALAYGRDIDYVCFTVNAVAEGSLARVGERLVVARDLLDDTLSMRMLRIFQDAVQRRGAVWFDCRSSWQAMAMIMTCLLLQVTM